MSEFVEGDAEVLCVGVQAVQLGHSLDAASAVVLTGLPWSFSALSQFEAAWPPLVGGAPFRRGEKPRRDRDQPASRGLMRRRSSSRYE
jgi:hypothetical protein